MNLEITFSQLEALTNPKVIDIRTPAQFAYDTYPGAENIPAEKLHPEQFWEPIYLLCQSGIIYKKMRAAKRDGQFAFFILIDGEEQTWTLAVS